MAGEILQSGVTDITMDLMYVCNIGSLASRMREVHTTSA